MQITAGNRVVLGNYIRHCPPMFDQGRRKKLKSLNKKTINIGRISSQRKYGFKGKELKRKSPIEMEDFL
jgi:hypothetical protein